jgi:hypothetical protein
VIVDSEPLHEKAYRQTSLYLGRDLTQEEVASLRGTVDEIGAAKLLQYNPGAALSVPQVMEYYNNLFKTMFDQVKLIPRFSGVHPEGAQKRLQTGTYHIGFTGKSAACIRDV